MDTLKTYEPFAARVLFVLFVTLSVFGILCLALAWKTAVELDSIPQSLWTKGESNHGLWHGHTSQLLALECTDFSLFVAGFCALLSTMLKPSKPLLALTISTYAFWFVSIIVHFNLCD